jgi:hypothetical protein
MKSFKKFLEEQLLNRKETSTAPEYTEKKERRDKQWNRKETQEIDKTIKDSKVSDSKIEQTESES